MKYFAQRFVTTQRDLFVPVVSCCVLVLVVAVVVVVYLYLTFLWLIDWPNCRGGLRLFADCAARRRKRGTLSGTNELEIVVIVRHMSSTQNTQKTCIPYNLMRFTWPLAWPAELTVSIREVAYQI